MRANVWPRVAALWLLLLLSARAADELDALPTLFDFLGAMQAGEAQGEWVDPLDMEQMEDLVLTQQSAPEKVAAPSDVQPEKQASLPDTPEPSEVVQ